MLDLSADAAALTAELVDIASVSGDEKALADLVEAALCQYPVLAVQRDGNVVIARTALGRAERVVLAGHLDTVPIADNVPSSRDGDLLLGCGTSDMKSGVAVQLRLAHLVGTHAVDPRLDLTWVFYDCEEVESERNGLGRLARTHPELLAGDLAVLLEPSNGLIEGGCQGTMRARLRVTGQRAHSARSWLGSNAIHALAPILERLASYQPRVVLVDGLEYREGLNAVSIEGGVAGNVIPDEASLTVNYRFAPDRSEKEAAEHVREVFADYSVEIVDSAPGARPGLDAPLAQALVVASGAEPSAKFGWTDVARFGQLGIPAVNLGPGDPNMAHKRDEYVRMAAIEQVEKTLTGFLSN